MTLIVIAAASFSSGATDGNALPNPSFEEGAAEVSGWNTRTWAGEGQFERADTGHTGGRSVMLASDAGADVTWSAEVAVTPFSTYRLSGWIKTANVKASTGQGALFNVHQLRGAQTPAVKGTADWTRVEVEFDTGNVDRVMVNCLFGGWGLATGTAWYDDICLERIAMEDLEPAAAIDAGAAGHPISPYVYGQFIEHLGRCIYGGIWAEML
ncbi:MAG: carbohydrate binding domain-containing protein, partial [Candidatus Hydrogenedentes bacterium]|nr:carbohydrate binding domain-containing protein [Candidatus Hydrogenedentota bacterium]